MARKAAVSAAKEMSDGFEALSSDNREWMKHYEDLGWRFSFTDSEWWAEKGDVVEDGGDGPLGPYDSFMVMMNEVEAFEKQLRGLEKVTEDNNGNTYLPGAEEYSNKELDALVRQRRESVAAFKMAQKRVSDANQDVLNMYNKYPNLFVFDEGSGKHVYNSPAGGGLRIRHDTVDKVESFDESPEPKKGKRSKKDK